MPNSLHSLPPTSRRWKIRQDESENAKYIKRFEDEIISAIDKGSSLNSLADILALLFDLEDPQDTSKGIYALYRVFVSVIVSGRLLSDSDESGKVVKAWLWEKFMSYVDFVGALLQDEEKFLRISALQIMFSLLKQLSTSLTQSSALGRPQFHVMYFRKIVSSLLICPHSRRGSSICEFRETFVDTDVLNFFYETWFGVYDDIRWFFLREAATLMNKHSTSEYPNLAINLLAILERLTTFPTEPSELNAWWVVEFGTKPFKPKNAKKGIKDTESFSDEDDLGKEVGMEVDDDWRKFFEEEQSLENGAPAKQPGIRLQKMTIHQSLHTLSSHQAVFTRAWLTLLLRLSLGDDVERTKAHATRVLKIMHRGVIPHFTRPILLMDWIATCVDFGGSVGLLALNALFVLLKEHNLDYPLFYTRLYAFLDRDVLHVKHRARFFRLIELFLSSTHLPAALLASFVKKLSRLSLTAPPAAIVMVVPFVYNILKRHPALMVMIHRCGIDDAYIDPFLADERDPMKTRALESSLWDLLSHTHHYHAGVSTLCKMFSEAFTKQGYTLEDFLDHTYHTLLETELSRKMTHDPALEIESTVKVFPEGVYLIEAVGGQDVVVFLFRLTQLEESASTTDKATNIQMSTDAAYHESDWDADKGGESEKEKGGAKQKSSGAKTKDLSHVPCKFFKVGGCTAGASCPFAHVVFEPGQQKEVCTWFVKGNCKFGHKCALAHVLPGQSMAMDRKNKKAAQTAASASGDKNKAGGKVTKRDAGGSGSSKLPLLGGGSTAPTRILNSSSSGSSKSGRPPINMSLKATISPSAPAPPLNDTDFASFAPLDGLDRDLAPQSTEESPVFDSKKGDTPVGFSRPMLNVSSLDPIPLSPSAPRPPTITNIKDFGPIGSPPNYRVGQPIYPIRTNGSTVSPATSPRDRSNMINHGSPPHGGPLSAPGNQEYFVSSSFSVRGPGIPASLGSGLAMRSGRRGFDDSKASGDFGPNSFTGLLSTQLSSSMSQNSNVNGVTRGEYDITIEYSNFSGANQNSQKGMETAVEDEELEDFLPSSLNDLLTPEERSRRMSRSNSGQKSGISHLTSALASANLGIEQSGPLTGNQMEVPAGGNSALGHRYSHSVPAPTLLADIKSIWSEPSMNPTPSSSLRGGVSSATIQSTIGRGNAHADEVELSMSVGSVGGGTPSSFSMVSPSNASAAFLPGLHKHYLDAKAKQAQQAQLGFTGIRPPGLRGASNPMFASSSSASGNSLASNYLPALGAAGSPSTVSSSSNLHMHIHGNTSTTYRTPPSPFDLTQTLHQPQPQAARPISNLTAQASKCDDSLLAPNLLSPSSRALQSHAPGQSLPQGLAAGYSRIHALPPLSNMTGPSNGSFIAGSSPGAALGNNSEGPFGEWKTAGSNHQQTVPSTISGQGVSGSLQSNPGLDSMFSRLSYAATTRNTGVGHPGALSGAPPGLARNISGGKYNLPLSPLSGPVVTRDDDILFDMDK